MTAEEDLNKRITEHRLSMLETVIEGHAFLTHHGSEENREYHKAQVNALQNVYKQATGKYHIKIIGNYE